MVPSEVNSGAAAASTTGTAEGEGEGKGRGRKGEGWDAKSAKDCAPIYTASQKTCTPPHVHIHTLYSPTSAILEDWERKREGRDGRWGKIEWCLFVCGDAIGPTYSKYSG